MLYKMKNFVFVYGTYVGDGKQVLEQNIYEKRNTRKKNNTTGMHAIHTPFRTRHQV